MNFKLVALLLIGINIIWDVFLQVLDRRSLKNQPSRSVADIYDPEEYRKWRSYKSEKSRMQVFGSVVGYAAILSLIAFDCFAAFARLFPDNLYLQLISVILFNSIAEMIVDLPFSIYSTFVIEEKYGFNRTTGKTFVMDTIKSLIMGLILEIGLVSLFAVIHQAMGVWFVPVFAGAFVLIGLLLSMLYPALSRLFNKFKPLDEGSLKENLTRLLTNHGYKVRAVEVMDASKRSTKTNAYFTGVGPTKSIVLYDTLVEAMSEDEICAVFAHEMGHGIHHDIVFNRLFSVLNSLLIAGAAWLVVSSPEIFPAFGFNGINYGFAFILMGFVMNLISPLLGLASSTFSRRAEYRADATAAEEGYGPALISALKVLSKKNLSDLAPDPLLVKLTYSHPTLAQRIEAIEAKLQSDKTAGK